MYCDYDINMCIDFFVIHLNVIIDKHDPLKYKKVRQNNVPYIYEQWIEKTELPKEYVKVCKE